MSIIAAMISCTAIGMAIGYAICIHQWNKEDDELYRDNYVLPKKTTKIVWEKEN